MAWESIASLLSVQMTGSEAAKRFRTLRTIFGRHFKKVRLSQPRSGAGSNWPVYQPSWPLYEELLFLADVIKPRTTKSNISVKSVSILKSRGNNHNRQQRNAAIGFNKSWSQPGSSSSSAHTSSSARSSISQLHSSPTCSTQLQQNDTFNDMNEECDLQESNQIKNILSGKVTGIE
ncbi:hypothetical protein ALC57_09337 [Trachymyrmex cornetzi]|uniref:MADF domain-containing protein n=2 Tax=Trachymyrmex cornetzi TaxID=471704 RepID=A0A151J5F1_9HYME|nr:hypothetical protein ALC57_09337 [Trachymyrmex cornetzi]